MVLGLNVAELRAWWSLSCTVRCEGVLADWTDSGGDSVLFEAGSVVWAAAGWNLQKGEEEQNTKEKRVREGRTRRDRIHWKSPGECWSIYNSVKPKMRGIKPPRKDASRCYSRHNISAANRRSGRTTDPRNGGM
ncbi:unnamed protein product [Arctogadus glacialis]